MTPHDLIADLRDIHLPAEAGEAAVWLSPAPLIFFAAVLAAGAWWTHRRRTAWRREGARRLHDVRGIDDPARRQSALIALFRQAARRAGEREVPDYLFQPPGEAGAQVEDRLVADIQRRLG